MKKQTGQKEIMKKVLDYIRPQWLLVMLSLLMAVVSVALTLYLPVLTGNVVDHILGPGKVEFSAIFEIMRTMAAAIVVTAAAQWIMNVCNNKIVYTVTRNIREEAFAEDRDSSAEVSGYPLFRRYCQPYHRGCRSVCRWTFNGLYAAVYRYRHDRRDPDFSCFR